MVQKYLSSSREDTQEIAQRLVADLDSGTTICLFGELAAGKTTFTQGVAQYFGINRLTSPTFTIMKEYPISDKIIQRLFHLDLYRLNSSEDLKAFSLDEIINDPSNLIIVEWPEKFIDQMPTKRIDVEINTLTENEREITINKYL